MVIVIAVEENLDENLLAFMIMLVVEVLLSGIFSRAIVTDSDQKLKQKQTVRGSCSVLIRNVLNPITMKVLPK